MEDKIKEYEDAMFATWPVTPEEDEAMNVLMARMKKDIDDQVMQYIVEQSCTLQEPPASISYEITVDTITDADGNDVQLSYNFTPNDCYMGYDTDGCRIEVAPSEIHTNNAVQINDKNGDLVVRIDTDGTVTLGDKAHPQFAAQEFWDRVADIGGHFYKRMNEVNDMNDQLRDDYNDLLADFESEQSQRIELQELINDIGEALGAPEAMEIDLANIAAKMKEQLDHINAARSAQKDPSQSAPKEHGDAAAAAAYKRAMKIVR